MATGRAAQVGTRYNGNATAVQRAARVGIGTQYNGDAVPEQNRRQVGPTILFDRPRQDPHSSLQSFPFGPATLWTSAEPMCDGWGGTFQPSPAGRERRSGKQRTERSAMAVQRAARVGIGTLYNTRSAG